MKCSLACSRLSPPWSWSSPRPIFSSSIRSQADLGPIHLGDLLTWGAFTYPFAFLVTDLTNRYDGATRARLVVVVGFVLALGCRSVLSTPRIAIASATAFLVGQLLDISVFSRLRNRVLVPAAAGRVAVRFAARYADLFHHRLRAGSRLHRWPVRHGGRLARLWRARGLASAPKCRSGPRSPPATSW